MTREEILAMVPGPELDNLVTHEIMGREGEWSSSISAAWEVVEKISETLECHFEMGTIWPKPKSPMEYVAVIYTLAFDKQYRVEAPTAPLTICRVALLAVLEATP